jgi:hypothetical protein
MLPTHHEKSTAACGQRRRADPVPLLALVVLGALPNLASAQPLVLERAMLLDAGSESKLWVTGHATFDFDADKGVLTASGTWLATYGLPGQPHRFAHKVEDMVVTADGEIRMRSYECVEGFFGAQVMARNLCGNYSFGANGTDDGGFADDVVNGPPISLADYRVDSFDWNGDALVVVLAGGGEKENRLTLTFSPPPPPPGTRR